MSDIKKITDERGSDYGHPLDQFNTTQEMFKLWEKRRSGGIEIDPELDNALRHIVYYIIDKMVRSAENPYKQDNYDDIQGYASLFYKSIEELEIRKGINNENSSY